MKIKFFFQINSVPQKWFFFYLLLNINEIFYRLNIQDIVKHIFAFDTEPAKQLALYEPEKRHGSAKRGAPPPSYLKHVTRSLYEDNKALKITKTEIEPDAKDRIAWHRRINEIGQDKSPRQNSKSKKTYNCIASFSIFWLSWSRPYYYYIILLFRI